MDNTTKTKVQTNSRLTEALKLAAQELKVFPVEPGAKEPLLAESWPLAATSNRDIIKDWWQEHAQANIGIKAGEDLVIIDVDRKPDKPDGWATVGKLIDQKTVSATTPSGGYHFYYIMPELPEGMQLRGNLPGVDIIHGNRYAVAPPSRLVNGDGSLKEYEWLKAPGEVDIAPLPDGLLDAILKPLQPDSKAEMPELLAEPPPLPLDKLKPSHKLFVESGQLTEFPSRSEMVPSIAARLYQQWWTDAEVLTGLWHNQYVQDYAMEHRQQDANRALVFLWEENIRDNRLPPPREVFQPVGALVYPPWEDAPLPVASTPEAVFKFRGLDDILIDLSPTEWLVKDYFPIDTLGQIWGDRDTYKSFLVLDLALSIATGYPWQGHPVVDPGPVLYICGEGHKGIGKRIAAWFNDRGLDAKGHPFAKSEMAADFYGETSADKVHKAVQAFAQQYGKQPKLIVIDTLARNMGAGKENASEDMNQFIAHVEKACRLHTGAAVLIVHHTGHGDKTRASGSYKLPAGVDVEYSLKRLDDTDKKKYGDKSVELECQKLKDDERPDKMILTARVIRLPFMVKGEVISSLVLDKIAETPQEVKEHKARQVQHRETMYGLDIAQQWLAHDEVIRQESSGRVGLEVVRGVPLPEDAIAWSTMKERMAKVWELQDVAAYNRLKASLPLAGSQGHTEGVRVTLEDKHYRLWLSKIPPEKKNGTLLIHMRKTNAPQPAAPFESVEGQ